jgi:hypothetical protein
VTVWCNRVPSGVCSRISSGRVHRQHQRVERAAALLGGTGGVRGGAVEPELDRDPGQATGVAGAVPRARVPVEDGVAVVEQPGPGHEHLRRPAFLRRAHVEPHRALERPGLDLLGDGGARRQRRGAEQVVPARVPVPVAVLARLAERHRLLR